MGTIHHFLLVVAREVNKKEAKKSGCCCGIKNGTPHKDYVCRYNSRAPWNCSNCCPSITLVCSVTRRTAEDVAVAQKNDHGLQVDNKTNQKLFYA